MDLYRQRFICTQRDFDGVCDLVPFAGAVFQLRDGIQMCIRDRAYILYREKRAALRRVRADLAREVGDDALEDVLRQIQKDFEEEVYPNRWHYR